MKKFDEEELLDKDPENVRRFLYYFIDSVDRRCRRAFRNTEFEINDLGDVVNKNAAILKSEIKRLTENVSTLASSLSNLILQLNEHEEKIKSLSKDIDLLKLKLK
tara:strand:+ start:3720 stop:4034 length:315 start_codon:yes stop_codon:yes gene_type:complete